MFFSTPVPPPHLIWTAVNYEGEEKEFTRRHLLQISNGFVAEVGGQQDYGSFETFENTYREAVMTDDVLANQRVITYRRSRVDLALSHSLTYDGLKYALADGQQISGRLQRVS